MKKIVVTGGSGRLGRWTVKELLEHGYEVISVDQRRPQERICRHMTANLEDLGEVYGVLQGADAVVHLGAIPAPYSHPNEVVFRNNVLSTYNVLEAAAGLGIKKAAIASSESSYGIVFAIHDIGPLYVPMDEDHPQLAEDCYALSKLVDEKTAEMFHRRTGMQVVSLRFGWVAVPEDYQHLPQYNKSVTGNEKSMFTYIDVRDAAAAIRLSLEKDGLGAVALNIQADNTMMDMKSRDIMATKYPEVQDFREPLDGYENLISNKKAKQLLDWKPVHNWRDYVEK